MGHPRRGGALAAVLTLLLAGAVPASAAGPDRYRNPVSAGFADLVDRTYAGDAVAPDQRPAYAAPGSGYARTRPPQ